MGWNVYNLLCCCRSSDESIRVDLAVAREQQAAAAEKRLKEQENRGIKNPERVKRMQREQQKRDEADRSANVGPSTGLKWQVNN
ncbi:Small VCP/p97-interacting protein [Cinara cedri]|uniref:Small VCP/p97-interacting protein n=1 Tax=Cinara cedri TaxID=506608 RepID=A0A5E4M347_9HEMI|nr:Small VCP/p97-interacting protein [Cinara cedri]